MSKYLTWGHVLATLTVLTIIVVYSLKGNAPPRSFLTWEILQEEWQQIRIVTAVLFILFTGGQVAFVINLVGGLIRFLTR